MSWLFSRALVEAFWAGTCSAGDACAPSSANPTPPVFCSHGRMTGFSRLSQFGMTCEPLTDDHGEALLTWFQEVSRAKTSALPAKVQASTESAADCGGKWPASLAKFDRDSCSWKTHQCSLFEAQFESLRIWPRWAMWDQMACWELSMPEPRTNANASGSEPAPPKWPTIRKSDADRGGRGDLIQAVRGNANSHFKMWQTPVADDAVERAAGKWNSRGEPKLSAQVKMWPTPKASANENRQTKLTPSQLAGKHGLSLCAVVNMKRFPTPTKQDANNNGGPAQMERNSLPLNAVAGGALNPVWVEWLMGWPLGWTDLQPLAMARFQQWSASHGKPYNK